MPTNPIRLSCHNWVFTLDIRWDDCIPGCTPLMCNSAGSCQLDHGLNQVACFDQQVCWAKQSKGLKVLLARFCSWKSPASTIPTGVGKSTEQRTHVAQPRLTRQSNVCYVRPGNRRSCWRSKALRFDLCGPWALTALGQWGGLLPSPFSPAHRHVT